MCPLLQPLENCVGCLQKMPQVKLQKRCAEPEVSCFIFACQSILLSPFLLSSLPSLSSLLLSFSLPFFPPLSFPPYSFLCSLPSFICPLPSFFLSPPCSSLLFPFPLYSFLCSLPSFICPLPSFFLSPPCSSLLFPFPLYSFLCSLPSFICPLPSFFLSPPCSSLLFPFPLYSFLTPYTSPASPSFPPTLTGRKLPAVFLSSHVVFLLHEQMVCSETKPTAARDMDGINCSLPNVSGPVLRSRCTGATRSATRIKIDIHPRPLASNWCIKKSVAYFVIMYT